MIMAVRDSVWVFVAILSAAGAATGADPIEFDEQTDDRLVAGPEVGAEDTEEKHYAWGDVDLDGDDDLVIVRSPPGSVAGGCRNVLLLNQDGVLVDRTTHYIFGFLDETNDRDVVLVDVDNDGWPDIVTAAA